jgi:hypothetical protein
MGGQFVGDPRAFVYLVPIAWILSMVSAETIWDPWPFSAKMLANAIAFALCFAMLLVFRGTIFRERERRTIALPIVVGAGLALGASKVAITAAVTAALTGDWGGVDPLAVRIAAGAITGGWFVPVSAFILAIHDRYRTARKLVFAERLRASGNLQPSKLTGPAPARLAAVLDDARRVIREHSGQPQALADSLTVLLDDKIRPLSRELLSASGRRGRDSSKSELLRIVVSRHKYWPALTTLALLLSSGPLIVSTVGLAEGIARLSILASLAWVTLRVLGRIPPQRASLGALVFLSAVVMFASINELIAQLAFGGFGNFATPVAIVLNSSLFGALALLLGALRVTRSELDTLLEELGTILGRDHFATDIERELVRARHRELAHIIHGRLQNQILGLVLALGKDPHGSSTQDLVREIELLDAALALRGPLHQLASTTDLTAELTALAGRWKGVIDVTITTQLPAAMSMEALSDLVGLAEEGVTNAVRHGLASSVEIAIESDGDNCLLRVSDDGVGPRQGVPGIGTMTLNTVAGNSWTLIGNPAGAGSVLTAHIPTRSAPAG